MRLGASADSPPDLLAALATDPAVTVRAAVALNTAAPADADRILARDGDERVRTLLARKLAALVPGLQARRARPAAAARAATCWPSWSRTRRCGCAPPSPTW